MLRLNVRDVTRRLTRVNSDGLIVLGGSDTKRFVANWQAMSEVKNIKLDKLSDDLVGDTIIWGRPCILDCCNNSDIMSRCRGCLRGNTTVQETGNYGAYLVYETVNSFRN